MASLYLETSAMAELECTNKEADTSMLFHAVRTSSNGFQTIVICSPDTDVTVLAVVLNFFFNLVLCSGWQFVEGSPIHICTGTKHHVHYIHVFGCETVWGTSQ